MVKFFGLKWKNVFISPYCLFWLLHKVSQHNQFSIKKMSEVRNEKYIYTNF